MNKNLKRIIAIALAIGTVSAVAPAKDINLLTTKAYASSTNEDTELSRLKLLNASDSDSNIQLYEDEDRDEKLDQDDLSEDDTYYAKTSASKIKVDTSGVSDKYIKVFKGESDNTIGKDPDDEISISGDTTITIRIYDEDVSDEKVKYDDDDDDYNDIGEYKIEIDHTGSSSDDDDDDADDYDEIYLDTLSVDGQSISLSEDKVAYTYNVPNSTKEVTIKAVPEDEDDDEVTIDDTDVDDSDKWKKEVSLNEGDNKFEITVENDDDDEDRTYTLTINRAKPVVTNTATTQAGTATNVGTTTTTVNVKPNQWVQVNGAWQYNDSTGKPLRSSWVQNYYLQDNGNMATGWKYINGSWYYLGSDGAKKTGWQSVGGTWYYLDSQGIMQTGWIKDIDGKYYYLNSNGSMAANTTVGGYKLGADGAWIR